MLSLGEINHSESGRNSQFKSEEKTSTPAFPFFNSLILAMPMVHQRIRLLFHSCVHDSCCLWSWIRSHCQRYGQGHTAVRNPHWKITPLIRTFIICKYHRVWSLFVVLRSIMSKNIRVFSLSNTHRPTSSIIRHDGFTRPLIVELSRPYFLVSVRRWFSSVVFRKYAFKPSWQHWQPYAIARCVFPTPCGPMNARLLGA